MVHSKPNKYQCNGICLACYLLQVAVILITLYSVSKAFIRVTVFHYEAIDLFADVVGWIYFVAWSVSFYPQIYENFKRKR